MAAFSVTVTLARTTPASQLIVNPADGTAVSAFPNAGYWTGPLPDIVLAPLSSVRVWIFRAGDTANAFSIGQTVVTVTPTLPAAEASLVVPVPLWLPLPVERAP